MSTIINTPGKTEDSGSNLIVAIILIVILSAGAILFWIYGLPIIQDMSNQNRDTTNINVTVPNNTTPSTTPQTP